MIRRAAPNENEESEKQDRKLIKTDKKDDSYYMRVEEVSAEDTSRRNLAINIIAGGLLVASGVASASLFQQTIYTPEGFTRLPQTQFIAALGDPQAREGTGAQEWGLWSLDPGPRGVYVQKYADQIAARNNQAPLGWKFDGNDWWLEEHGESFDP
jgi:hypothetical protein